MFIKSLTCLATLTFAGGAAAQDFAALEAEISENPLKSAYFGETHVHTSYSLDAYIGGANLTPFDAYRFAKGQTVMLNGQKHNIGTPLDFAAVTDHAEYLGEMFTTQVPGAPGFFDQMPAELRSLEKFEDREEWFVDVFLENQRSGDPGHMPFYQGEETTISAWKDVMIGAAQMHYEPGQFTTLIGFEWTSVVDGGNMHRNILFRDDVVPDAPFSALDSSDEERLWHWMEEQERAGSTLLAIPHNSNGSKGYMFEPVDNSGNPLSREYAETRVKWEPLIEMMQIKGNSEVVSSLWPADEFANFENAPGMQAYSGRTFQKENFVRQAVTKGLEYQRDLGANPYKLGFVGGTDSHNGVPSDVREDNAIGSHGGYDSTVENRREGEVAGWILNREANPGALTGVWATKNTRGAIWDAMAARETFATSGTRIMPRFFGGNLSPAEDSVSLVEQGYANGVPMGGDLTDLDGPPTFNVHAVRSPLGANLDRIQIIKGWVDAEGEARELIVNVVWAGDREPDPDGTLPVVGSTVDLESATFTNEIGAPELFGSWTDDDFDPGQPALYYVRVLEIPTPRWTTYDAVQHGLPLLENVPETIQERAWTSPIWYTPNQG